MSEEGGGLDVSGAEKGAETAQSEAHESHGTREGLLMTSLRLNEYCDKLVQSANDTSAPVLHIKVVASKLGTSVRRLYDIIGVYSCLGIVTRAERCGFHWLGVRNVDRFLTFIKAVALEFGVGRALESLCLSEGLQSSERQFLESLPHEKSPFQGVLRNKKTLAAVTVRLLMIFLASGRCSLAMSVAGLCACSNAEDARLRIKQWKRVYDAANILHSVSLVRKEMRRDESGKRQAVFHWVPYGRPDTYPYVPLTLEEMTCLLGRPWQTLSVNPAKSDSPVIPAEVLRCVFSPSGLSADKIGNESIAEASEHDDENTPPQSKRKQDICHAESLDNVQSPVTKCTSLSPESSCDPLECVIGTTYYKQAERLPSPSTLLWSPPPFVWGQQSDYSRFHTQIMPAAYYFPYSYPSSLPLLLGDSPNESLEPVHSPCAGDTKSHSYCFSGHTTQGESTSNRLSAPLSARQSHSTDENNNLADVLSYPPPFSRD